MCVCVCVCCVVLCCIAYVRTLCCVELYCVDWKTRFQHKLIGDIQHNFQALKKKFQHIQPTSPSSWTEKENAFMRKEKAEPATPQSVCLLAHYCY